MSKHSGLRILLSAQTFGQSSSKVKFGVGTPSVSRKTVLLKNVRASDATWKPLVERLSLQEMQELVATIGYYMTASRFLENFDVDIERDANPKESPLKGSLLT